MKEKTLMALSELNLAYGKSFDKIQLEYYVRKLSHINPLTLEMAVSHLCSKSKFLPTPAEIIDKCDEISDYVNDREVDSEVDAWGLVNKIISAYGCDRGLDKVKEENELAYEAVRGIWKSCCLDPVDQQQGNKAYFMKRYKELLAIRKSRQWIRDSVANVPLMQEAHERAVLANTNKGKKRIAMLCNGLLKEIPDEKEVPKVQ